MNKTLYVKDGDGPLWDRARELTGDKISQFILEKLRVFVAEQDGKQQGFERITLRYVEKGIPKAQAFVGRWLIAPEQPWEGCDEVGDLDNYAIALTAKDNVVVFNFGNPPEKGEFGWAVLTVHESFEQANKHHPWDPIEAAMRRRGIAVQELDI